jgi:hypothetical protein
MELLCLLDNDLRLEQTSSFFLELKDYRRYETYKTEEGRKRNLLG